MDINKQLFEDVLSGKLKGTFVQENGKKLKDKLLTDISKFTVMLNGKTFYFNGKPTIGYYDGILDIIDFIPNTDMKENELKITIPEGQEIDWQESAKQEKIVFKKKDTKPRSWVEYCNLQASKNAKGYFTDSDSNLHEAEWDRMTNPIMWRTVFPSKELCNASRAMAQLMSIRDSWIEDWKPDWSNDGEIENWCVVSQSDKIITDYFYRVSRPLSFPTEEMATDFMNTFKDLLEIAKPFI